MADGSGVARRRVAAGKPPTATPRRAPGEGGRHALGGALGPVFVPKASDVLASRLREMIVSGQFPEGDNLPTERDLVADSGLSRASVREALRVLEVEGLISTRPGRTGGSTVTLPGRASVARSVRLFVRSHGITLGELLECRMGIEPFLASLAATKRTEAELDEMEAIHAEFARRVDDVPVYKELNLDWHLAVARASRNEPLVALMEAIAQPIQQAAGYQQVTTDAIRRQAVDAHARVMKAIREEDAKAAFRHMDRHVTAYSEVARQALGLDAAQ